MCTKNDSLNLVESMMTFEEIFEVEFPDWPSEFRHPQGIVKWLEESLASKTPNIAATKHLVRLAAAQQRPELICHPNERWTRDQIEAIVRDIGTKLNANG